MTLLWLLACVRRAAEPHLDTGRFCDGGSPRSCTRISSAIPQSAKEKGRVMQEITAAYTQGNLHALLQLELEWLATERGRGSSEP